MDRHLHLEGRRKGMSEFSPAFRKSKLLEQFSLFLKSYTQSKQCLLDGHLLDAYSSVTEALQHWARIAVIEEGFYPEKRIWTQVRKLNPGVYKLYEELTSNNETVEQRVQLILLACEFSAMSKMETCCAALLDVLRAHPYPLSVLELASMPELAGLNIDLPLLLSKLARKMLVREVLAVEDESHSLELKYTV